MNHIHRLTASLGEADAKIAAAKQVIRDLHAHLDLPKYQQQADGSRGDWIATADVRRWLDTITTTLNGV